MRIVVVEPPPDSEAWLRRRALGQDGFDEVWKGEYHVAPWPILPTAASVTNCPSCSTRWPQRLACSVTGR